MWISLLIMRKNGHITQASTAWRKSLDNIAEAELVEVVAVSAAFAFDKLRRRLVLNI